MFSNYQIRIYSMNGIDALHHLSQHRTFFILIFFGIIQIDFERAQYYVVRRTKSVEIVRETLTFSCYTTIKYLARYFSIQLQLSIVPI